MGKLKRVLKEEHIEIPWGVAMGLGFQSWNFQEVSYKLAEKYILTPAPWSFS